MTALIRSELLQVRTLRSSYFVLAGLLGLVVAIVWGTLADSEIPTMTIDELREPVVAGAGAIVAAIGALFAAGRVAGEYRYGTIANRALATPRRARLLGGKLLTYGSLGALVTAVAFALGLAVATPLIAADHMSLALSAPDVASMLGRAVAAGALFTMIGVTLGFISRSQQAGVVIVFGTFFAEKIVGGLMGNAAHYLPFGLLSSLLSHSGPVSPATAAAVLAAITAGLVALAAWLLNRRDVS